MKLLKLVPENTNIDFLKWQWPTTILSVALMIASWVLVYANGLNYGVDFAGGQMIKVTFTQSEKAPIADPASECAIRVVLWIVLVATLAWRFTR